MTSSLIKTIVATGLSSGLGFEALKQLLADKAHPYRLVLGARDVPRLQEALKGVQHDRTVDVLPLDLADLRSVNSFAQATLSKVDKVDFLIMNAGLSKASEESGPNGSRWCEALIVNHLSQHYLVHLLREKLTTSHARLIFVSSGAIMAVSDPSSLDTALLAGSGAGPDKIYPGSKFVQLLGAHWWRREFASACTVIAVSPGMIPSTGLGRHTGMELPASHPDAKTVAQGGENILRPMYVDDLPEDSDRIFFTSWGEWWPREKIEKTCDKALQDKWCPSLQQIEHDEKLV